MSGFVSFEHDARSTAAADKGRGGHGRPVPGERIATPTHAPDAKDGGEEARRRAATFRPGASCETHASPRRPAAVGGLAAELAAPHTKNQRPLARFRKGN